MQHIGVASMQWVGEFTKFLALHGVAMQSLGT